MLRVPRTDLRKDIKFLENNRIPFTIQVSHKSYIVRSGMGEFFYTDNFMTVDGLNLVRKVKKHVKDKGIADNYPKRTPLELKLKYLRFDKRYIGTCQKDLIEIDLDSAYWITALKLGVIDKEIFDRGMEISNTGKRVDKIARLAPLGSLAKEVKLKAFNGYQYGKSQIIEDSSETRHLWDLISHKVDAVMQACMRSLKDRFVFYWTDAIFLKDDPIGKNISLVDRVIKAHDYGYKIIKNDWYEFRPDACYVFDSVDKGRKITDKELGYIDIKWVKKNVDLKRILKLPKSKQLPSDKELLRYIQKHIRVRNFCYAINNKSIWKFTKKK